VALSNLEERLMRWHNSFVKKEPPAHKISATALAEGVGVPGQYTFGAPPQAKGERCVVKLHRFTCDVSWIKFFWSPFFFKFEIMFSFECK
jgi:hypothetical protein